MDAIAGGMGATGGLLGGYPGVGIFVLTAVIRAASIPILLPLAVRSRDRQLVVRRIRPEIKALHKEWKSDPTRLSRELKKLHEANGIKEVDWPGAIAAMVQLPILIALFEAALQVSRGTALASGGLLVGIIAAGLAVFGTKVSGQSAGATWMLWASAVLPVAMAVWLGTGIGLYLSAFYGVGCIQALLMSREKTARFA